MSLLQRLYEPQAGTVLIDDVPLQAYDINFLRARIVIVDQNTVLLNATVRVTLQGSNRGLIPSLLLACH